MGIRERADFHFGKCVREERDRRGWSQEQLATLLSDKGIPVHASTIAKIESMRKPRPARLGEVIAIADLFEKSVDELLGRKGPDESTLIFALMTLAGYATDAQRHIAQAQHTTADIEEQVETVSERDDAPPLQEFHRVIQQLADHLRAAQAIAKQVESAARDSILEAGEEFQ